jgi:hypothetical protein
MLVKSSLAICNRHVSGVTIGLCLQELCGSLPSTMHPGLALFLRRFRNDDWYDGLPNLAWDRFAKTSRANYRDTKRFVADFWEGTEKCEWPFTIVNQVPSTSSQLQVPCTVPYPNQHSTSLPGLAERRGLQPGSIQPIWPARRRPADRRPCGSPPSTSTYAAVRTGCSSCSSQCHDRPTVTAPHDNTPEQLFQPMQSPTNNDNIARQQLSRPQHSATMWHSCVGRTGGQTIRLCSLIFLPC